jgi:hypothetical protein
VPIAAGVIAALMAVPAFADPDPTIDADGRVHDEAAYAGPVTTYLHKKPKAKTPAVPKIPVVSIRGGDHKGLSRILISWHSAVTYKVDETPGLVTITFSRPAKADLGTLAKQPLRNIPSITTVDDPDHLIVQLAVKSGERSRAFRTGNIVVVDILDSDATSVPSAPAPVTATASTGEKTEGKPDDTIIHMQPTDAAASLAVFRRGPYLWLATDDKLGEGAWSVSGPNAKSIGVPPTRYSVSNGTLLRFAYKGDLPGHVITRQHAGGWDVVFSSAPTPVAALAVQAVATENQVTVTAPGAAHLLSFTDPDLGDTLFVVPLPAAGEYVGKARRFSDADLLQTIQGVAAISHGDRAQIAAGLGAVTISGVQLSTDSGTGSAPPALFDLATWYNGGPSVLNKNRRAIEHAPIGDDASGERSRAIQMARLFLANGWGNECLGALHLAETVDPDIDSSPDFVALRGAAEALAARPDEATADLTIDALVSQPEAIVWRALGEASGSSDQRQEALAILRSNTKIFEKYPHELKTRFSLALAALAVSASELDAMEDALKLLTRNEPYEKQTQPAIATLKAAIALQRGKRPEAEKLYASIPAMRNQYWTALAGLSSVEEGLTQGTLTEAEAISRLDSLRFEWRGDDYEYHVLEKLGQLYLITGDYKNGLETLTNLMHFGEGSKYANDARQKMIDTAKLAFAPETTAAASPLDTYELYNTFVPYLPPGTISDSDVRTLSDRLAAIGVMDQAITLIQPQMEAATDPTVKAKLGARIAALRLLDDKPELALKALASSDFASIDDGLKTERKLLQAQALFKSGKPDDAVAALQGIQTREADALRVEIAWAQKNWTNAAAALERLAGPPPAPGATISEEQATIVLNEVVALNLANDPAGIEALRKSYGDAMAKTKKASAFALLTSPASDTHSPSIEAVKASVGGLDIFENYLSAYRQQPEKK